MDVKTLGSMDTYTDFKGLNALHHQVNTNPEVAKKEVAEQFESLLVQMLMKSMREANQALTSDSERDDQTAMYHDLFDKQLSLVMAHSGTGLAKVIEDSLERTQTLRTASTDLNPVISTPLPVETASNVDTTKAIDFIEPIQPLATTPSSVSNFDSTSEFVSALWASAKEAASVLGTDPKFLLAQAALETNWGKSILPMITGESTHNLFNIKADKSWEAASTQVNAVEYEDGLMVKNKSKFRAYESYKDSFADYVHFLKNNSRYEEALKHASNPQEFAQQLQKANYATDEKYSEKIMQIYSSKRLNDLVASQNLV